MNSIHNLRVAEECCNELTAAFRFVTAAESARNHDNLGILNAVGKGFDRFCNCSSRQVADYENFCSCTSPFKDSSGVIFAVCAWEYRNQDVRTSRLNGRELVNRIVIAVNRRLFCSGLDSARENRLKLLFPDLQKLWQLHGVVRANNGLFIGGCTNHGFICLCIAVQFNDKCTAAWLE